MTMKKLLLATVAAVMLATSPLHAFYGDESPLVTAKNSLTAMVEPNPSPQKPYQQAVEFGSGPVLATNEVPATKSGYVHIWIRSDNGDLLFINNVNDRVARLLKGVGDAAEWAGYWLVATKVDGRNVQMMAVEGTSPNLRHKYVFTVHVGENGKLSLASKVELKMAQ
jgi:hypothetical protein